MTQNLSADLERDTGQGARDRNGTRQGARDAGRNEMGGRGFCRAKAAASSEWRMVFSGGQCSRTAEKIQRLTNEPCTQRSAPNVAPRTHHPSPFLFASCPPARLHA